ncbi:MAG: RsmE family RNA methyltransferase [Eubacteriales bacterium]|nr:RsmE family RNA methyltransferase [Christensenellaceae bacterium]MDY2751755.1 RsmE family RNA methyltransferase [Eubacteriales bacterium]
MEIRRFLTSSDKIKNDVAEISGDEFTYAVKVLRQKTGFTVIVNTGDGYDRIGEISEITKDKLTVKIRETVKNEATPDKKITLYQGSCKQGKNEFIVQKAVELGISRIVFFKSDFVTEKEVNVERLRKIATEALKQCGRADSVEVEFTDYFNAVDNCENAVIFYEGECENTLSDIGNAVSALFVGSEGGFSEREVGYARERGLKTITLGKRILRAETASVVATSMIQYLTGGLV